MNDIDTIAESTHNEWANSEKIERLKEKTQELFSMALQSDLEHGVRWLNEQATERFHLHYPELYDAIKLINSDEFWES